MGRKKDSKIKKNGVYYTPKELAEHLALPLLDNSNLSILDPSYGEGSLLLAAEKISKEKYKRSAIHLFGCDIKPVNGLLEHLPEANLEKKDFFKHSTDFKYNVVLTNPPFVRHHLLENKKINKYRFDYPALELVNFSSDLWVYFIIKSILHLKPRGSMGAILPWSFLQADYAIPLRKYLFENFESIKLLSLTNKYFENTGERVVMLWVKNYGVPCTSIRVGSAKDLKKQPVFSKITYENWVSNRVICDNQSETNSLLKKYKEDYGFTNLGKYADVRIGVVSGAVDFFVMKYSIAKAHGFTKKNLVPILTNSKQFIDILNNQISDIKYLIKISSKHYLKFKKYIKSGVEKEYHLRAHSKLRKNWYEVKIGAVPDGFFPYRISKYPFLIRNEKRIQSTNAIHRVYFKGITDEEIKWIQVSLLSKPSQLSIETNSKNYGSGVLKLEPTAIKKTLVLKRKDKSINPVYEKIIERLKANQKEEASEIATNFINKFLKIDPEIANFTKGLVQSYQINRLTK